MTDPLKVVCPSCGADIDAPCLDKRARRREPTPLKNPHPHRLYRASPYDHGTDAG